jgi:hypothetical protein
MRLGIVADIHGNDVALRAVVRDAAARGVDRWWALGDLVLFGPRPVEVLEILRGLPGIGMLSGNTDRYVLTGEQPAPHATAADAAGDVGLVERYGAVAAGIGWTRGVLDQAGVLDVLVGLPAELRLRLPGGVSILGVHASPGADETMGPGSGLACRMSSLGRCWPAAARTSSWAGTRMPRPIVWSAASAPSTPAAPGCLRAAARPAGCTSKTPATAT